MYKSIAFVSKSPSLLGRSKTPVSTNGLLQPCRMFSLDDIFAQYNKAQNKIPISAKTTPADENRNKTYGNAGNEGQRKGQSKLRNTVFASGNSRSSAFDRINSDSGTKFSIDAPRNHAFVPISGIPSLAGSSIRDSYNRIDSTSKEAAQKGFRQRSDQGARGFPYNYTSEARANTASMRARSPQPDMLDNVTDSRSSSGGRGGGGRGGGGGGGGYGNMSYDSPGLTRDGRVPPMSSIALESVNHRHLEQQSKLAHKRDEFSARTGVVENKPPKAKSWDEPEVKRPTTDPTFTGPSAARNAVSSAPQVVNISELKQQLIAKQELVQTELLKKTQKKEKSTIIREVTILSGGLSVRDLSSKLSMRTSELVAKLDEMGAIDLSAYKIKARRTELEALQLEQQELSGGGSSSSGNGSGGDANANKVEDHMVDADTAELIVLEMGYIARRKEDKAAIRAAFITERPSQIAVEGEQAVELPTRAPVVSFLFSFFFVLCINHLLFNKLFFVCLCV
jgi:hypothetical protein